ncbi:hypothetical protein ACFCYC_18795 [Streptomyces sp. NPDC056402]
MDDDLQTDSDEDLFRNPVYYEPAGRNLTLTVPTSAFRKAKTS